MGIDQETLEEAVHRHLSNFYARRLQRLTQLRLKETLGKKNPYLFRAIGVHSGTDIVVRVLQAYMSSSEETMFGDAFFEPLAKEVSGGVAAGGAGVDVVVERDDSYTVISIKSGPNWGNSSQVQKLEQDFQAAQRRFTNKRLRKHFRALLGHCYGKKAGRSRVNRSCEIKSGQAFWLELTGDADFYLKLIRAMGTHPRDHRELYDVEWDKAVNRFVREFLNDFALDDGSIDWDKLVRFNSGIK